MNKSFFEMLIPTSLITGGLGILIKLFLSDWLKKSEKLQEIKDLAIQNQIIQLKDLASDSKKSIDAMKGEFNEIKISFIKNSLKLESVTEKMEPLTKAFQEYVSTNQKRLSDLEASTSQVQEIARGLIRVTEAKKKD